MCGTYACSCVSRCCTSSSRLLTMSTSSSSSSFSRCFWSSVFCQSEEDKQDTVNISRQLQHTFLRDHGEELHCLSGWTSLSVISPSDDCLVITKEKPAPAAKFADFLQKCHFSFFNSMTSQVPPDSCRVFACKKHSTCGFLSSFFVGGNTIVLWISARNYHTDPSKSPFQGMFTHFIKPAICAYLPVRLCFSCPTPITGQGAWIPI